MDGTIASPGNGLYRSTNRGRSFKRLAGTDQLNNSDSSSDPIGRITLAYGQAKGQGSVLWAALSDAGLAAGSAPGGLDLLQDSSGQSLNATNTVFNGLYRSDDDGTSFSVKATPQQLEQSPNSLLAAYGGLGYGIGVQGDYNLWVATDPKVPDQVYLGLEEVFQGTPAAPGAASGPYTFSTVQRYADLCGFLLYFQNVQPTYGVSCPSQSPVVGGKSTHPDQHAAIVVPTKNGSRIYTGNDGGFFRQDSHAVTPANTGDQTTTGFDNQDWVAMNTMSSTQPWHVALLPDNEVIAGLQDNGAILIPKGSNHGIEACGGDGINVLPTPDPNVFYCSYTGAQLYVTTDHGHTFSEISPGLTKAQFLSPAAIDPTNRNHLVAAANDIKESTEGANTQVEFDPVTGTIVSSQWQESYAVGATKVQNPTTGVRLADNCTRRARVEHLRRDLRSLPGRIHRPEADSRGDRDERQAGLRPATRIELVLAHRTWRRSAEGLSDRHRDRSTQLEHDLRELRFAQPVRLPDQEDRQGTGSRQPQRWRDVCRPHAQPADRQCLQRRLSRRTPHRCDRHRCLHGEDRRPLVARGSCLAARCRRTRSLPRPDRSALAGQPLWPRRLGARPRRQGSEQQRTGAQRQADCRSARRLAQFQVFACASNASLSWMRTTQNTTLAGSFMITQER